jgi:hypothetical protein
MIIIYRKGGGGGGGAQFKDGKKVILICKASDFNFLNKTKNEHRCSTILQNKTCFVIARRFFWSVLI